MPGASKNIVLVGIGALSHELAQELSARGIEVREATLAELGSLLGPPALLVLGPGAARSARLDVVRPFQIDDRPIIVLSEDGGAADQLRFLTSARVVHVPARGNTVQIATAIVRAAEPAGWEATETVRPPPAELPPEVMAEMTGSTPRSEPPELDSSLLESVRPGAPEPPPAPPAAARPSTPETALSPQAEEPAPAETAFSSAPADAATPAAASEWPEPEPVKPRKRSLAPVIALGFGCLGLFCVAVAIGLVIALRGGGDEVEPVSVALPEESARPAAPVPAPAEPAAAEPTAPPEADVSGAPEEPAQPPEAAAGTPDERLAAARAAEGPRDPRESDAIVRQATRALEADDVRGAEEMLGRALALDPDNPRAWAALGRLHLAKGEAQTAVRWLELAVDRRGRRAEYHLWLGDARRAAGDAEGARRAWQSALRRDPENREAQERLR